jgi:hypothetical protein
MLVDICKRHQIGVKKVQLTELLVLDPELTREPGLGEPESDTFVPEEASAKRRLRDEMLGDPERGLSVEAVAQLSDVNWGAANDRPRMVKARRYDKYE